VIFGARVEQNQWLPVYLLAQTPHANYSVAIPQRHNASNIALELIQVRIESTTAHGRNVAQKGLLNFEICAPGQVKGHSDFAIVERGSDQVVEVWRPAHPAELLDCVRILRGFCVWTKGNFLYFIKAARII
jgi:hypothetical protein